MNGYYRPRVAIGCNSERQRRLLHQILEDHGLRVVVMTTVDDPGMLELDRDQIDALLIDLDEEVERTPEMLDALMERALVPVLFNDGVQGRLDSPDSDHTWQHRLVKKVMLVARRSMDDSSLAEVARTGTAIPKRFPVIAQQRTDARLLGD